RPCRCSLHINHGTGEQGWSVHAAATLSDADPVDRDAWPPRSLGAAVSNGKHGIGTANAAIVGGQDTRRLLLHTSVKAIRYVDQTQSTSKPDPAPKPQDGGDSLPKKMLESAATSFASILVLAAGFAIAGYAYHKTYKRIVLKKMTRAFTPGDPVLELAAIGKEVPQNPAEADDRWVQRPEQSRIDKIVDGSEVGHYFLILGEKGTGKSSMLIEAMRKIDGDGVAMFEAHADLEIVRIRLGKALDFEFHEDYIGGYFSERGPRDTTALLDIERALNKLEKVAIVNRATRKKPLVVIINQMHLIRDDDDGKDLIELLQQRAEQWAASNLVTMVFNTDDYWVYERFKQLATRMEVMSVRDLPKRQAIAALAKYRVKYFNEKLSQTKLEEVYDLVGGRLSFLNRVAKSRDMIATCKSICQVEKTWFLNQCWILGAEMDDDVMDQQKWAAAAMVLAQALVDSEEDMELWDDEKGHVLPSFPMHKAQQIMTRADFIRNMDRLNLFTIAANAEVRASSVPMHRAFQEICAEKGFRDHLESTIQRISDIESLGRTRELVAKDLVLGGKYEIVREGKNGVTVKLIEGEDRGMYV
ncbi:ATPase prokaryote, partial [Colletotrichum incanum]